MNNNTPRPGVNTPHVRVPRAALDLTNPLPAADVHGTSRILAWHTIRDTLAILRGDA